MATRSDPSGDIPRPNILPAVSRSRPVTQRSDDFDIKQTERQINAARPTVSRDDRIVISASRNLAITGAALLRMISIDVQSSRSVPLSKCFTAIPIARRKVA
jgi:hypothetical protein